MPEPKTNTAIAAAAWADPGRAQRYDVDGNREFYRAAAAKLLELAGPFAGRGLDLGCGTGFSLEALVERAQHTAWVGMDSSPVMLAHARRRFTGTPFALGRAEQLPFTEASFDVVVASFSWHWFGRDAAGEILRVLRPGGSFLAAVPLRVFSRVAGNRALAAALMASRERYTRRPSQGFRLQEIRSALPPGMTVLHLEAHSVVESFADGAALLSVLASRGALAAIFGEAPPTVIETSAPVDFEWPFALLHARRSG